MTYTLPPDRERALLAELAAAQKDYPQPRYYGRSGPPRTPLQPKRNYSAYDPSEPEDAAYHSEAHRAEESARAAILWERGMAAEGRAKRA